MAFTDQEAFVVLMALRRICPGLDLPYQGAVLSAALKIENNLPAWLRRQTLAALNHIFIRPLPRHQVEGFDRIFACFQEALINHRTVRIQYRRTTEGRLLDMELCPVHLVSSDQRWHVLGKNPRTHDILCLGLDQIRSVEPAGKRFLLDPHFDVADHLGNAWSISPEGKLHVVRLRFMPEIASEVTAIEWHRSQRVRQEAGGSAVVEFRVDGLNEILWWILSYGDMVEVLAPKVLRDRVCRIAAQTLQANQENPAPAKG